jgi:hypothetical protein
MKEESTISKLIGILRSKLVPACFILSATGFVIYYLWKRIYRVKLNKWLEEYIDKVDVMLKEEGKELSIETISYILHLNTEIADDFYSRECYECEANRLQAYNDNKDGLYNLYMIDSINCYDKCLKKANSLLKQRLKVHIKKLESKIKSEMTLQTIYKLKNYRKQYDKLPEVSKDKLIECYLYYAENKKRNFYLDQKEMNLMKKNFGYEQTASLNIFRNKFKLVDYLLTDYEVHYKYLDQLIKQNDLLKIPKIRYYYDELNVLQDYI